MVGDSCMDMDTTEKSLAGLYVKITATIARHVRMVHH